MKFISSEVQTNVRTREALTKWTGGSDLVVASFYFWNAGTTLQKSLRGLLRSLLFQIANRRQDLMPIMMQRKTSSVDIPFESFESVQIHTWTEERLLSTLQWFLTHKPTSISLCFFIDGLDEFVGDEDMLVATIRLLNDTPQVRVCVSSRPEQIFRQGFSASPQLRLQDLNREDIEKAATDILFPPLTQRFLQEKEEIVWLIKDVIYKAQGVFLWLELMAKDLKKGVYSGDTLPELRARLKVTPGTIEGLYKHMLSKLDKSYLQEAIRYFRFLMALQDQVDEKPLSLLEFVCAEDVPWEHVLRRDLSYFETMEFHNTCHHVETRILTRCAGLVEIGKHRPNNFPGVVKQDGPFRSIPIRYSMVKTARDEHNVSRHLRSVEFIHRTAADFLRSHHQTFFQDSNWRSSAMLAVARGKLGLMSIVPIATSDRGNSGDYMVLIRPIHDIMRTLILLDAIEPTEETHPASQDIVLEMIDHTYRTISHIDACLNGPNMPWYERYEPVDLHICYCVEIIPFRDLPGFAAFYGCSKYMLRHISLHSGACEDPDLNQLLACTLIGYLSCSDSVLSPYLIIIEKLLRHGANPNSSFEFGFTSLFGHIYHPSAWSIFFREAVSIMFSPRHPSCTSQEFLDPRKCSSTALLLTSLVELFVLHDAYLNVSIFSETSETLGELHIVLMVEESPLSYWERMVSAKRAITETFEISKVALENLLRSHNAFHRRRIYRVSVPETGVNKKVLKDEKRLHQLSQEQSDRLCEVWPLHSRCNYKELQSKTETSRRVFKELKASLIDADLRDPSNLLLGPSYPRKVTDVIKEIRQGYASRTSTYNLTSASPTVNSLTRGTNGEEAMEKKNVSN